MAEEKITAAEAIRRIKSICQMLKPDVVWSITESGFVMNNEDLDKEFVLTINIGFDPSASIIDGKP